MSSSFRDAVVPNHDVIILPMVVPSSVMVEVENEFVSLNYMCCRSLEIGHYNTSKSIVTQQLINTYIDTTVRAEDDLMSIVMECYEDLPFVPCSEKVIQCFLCSISNTILLTCKTRQIDLFKIELALGFMGTKSNSVVAQRFLDLGVSYGLFALNGDNYEMCEQAIVSRKPYSSLLHDVCYFYFGGRMCMNSRYRHLKDMFGLG